jgi:hypothetical protein
MSLLLSNLVTVHQVRSFTPFVLLLLILGSVSCWGFRFAYEGLAEIIARTLTATSPRYSVIKELDRKLREIQLPPQAMEALSGGPGVDPRSLPLSVSMLSHMIANIQNVGESMFPSDVAAAGAKYSL